MSATALLVRTPWQFGDRSVKENIKDGVVLPKLKVEHPASRLGKPEELSLCGISRAGSRASANLNNNPRVFKPSGASHSRVSNLPTIPAGVEYKVDDDRSKPHMPVFGNNADLTNRIESRLTAMSHRSVDSSGSYKDRLSTTQLEKKIRDKMKTGYFSVKNLFQSYDPESRGKVTREQLLRILCTFLAMKISFSQFNRLMKRLGFENDKTVTFEGFYQFFKNKKEADGEYPTWFFQEEKEYDGKCTASKVHTYLKLVAAKSLENLLTSLKILNAEYVIKPEFENSVKGIGFELSPVEFEKLWKKYDDSGNGILEVSKLVERLTGNVISRQSSGHNDNDDEQSTREQSINIEKWLTKKFREGFHELQHAFKEVEVDGTVSREQFIKVLQDYGLFLKDNRLDLFLQRCNVPVGKKIDYKLFLLMFQNRSENGLTNQILHNEHHRYHQEADDESVVTDISAIEALLVDMFQGDFLKLLNKFQKIDHVKKGVISSIEFRAALESFFGVKILDVHFNELVKSAPTDASGKVKYQDFLQKFDSKSSKTIFDFASSVGDNELDYIARLPSRGSTMSRQSAAPSVASSVASGSADRSVAQLSAIIKGKLREDFETVETTFHELDDKNTKRMSKDILKKMLTRVGIRVSPSETDSLWEHIIRDLRGNLEFTQFIRHFGYSIKSAAFPNAKRNPPVRGDSDFNILSKRFNSSKDLVDDYVKNLVEKKYIDMYALFEAVDKSKTGYIEDCEFKKGIFDLSPDLTEEELITLAKKYSVDGKVPWRRFMSKLCPHRVISSTRPNMSDLIKHSSMEKDVDEVAEKGTPLMTPRLREKITGGNWKDIRQEFKLRDLTNKGFLTVEEFKDVLKQCKIILDSNDMYRVLSVLDEQLEGKIMFTNLCKLVPSNYST